MDLICHNYNYLPYIFQEHRCLFYYFLADFKGFKGFKDFQVHLKIPAQNIFFFFQLLIHKVTQENVKKQIFYKSL